MASYFEDYEIGDVARFGAYEVTREEVIEFASRYDPQPFTSMMRPLPPTRSSVGFPPAAGTRRRS